MSREFPERWFYCFVTGEVFQFAHYACPICGQRVTNRELDDGRHATGNPVAATEQVEAA